MLPLLGEKGELGKTVSAVRHEMIGKLFVNVLVTGVPKSCFQK